MVLRLRITLVTALAIGACALAATPAAGQPRSALRIFGYFQSQFEHSDKITGSEQSTSFQVQQLNLFLHRAIDRRWSAFVNFELVNSFSTSGDWGDFSIEEAWAMYRRRHFSVKMGLLIPTFNHLNEIKNRTPLLPYVIRPLVYEASLDEIVGTENFIPKRAYVETKGFIPIGSVKIDHALYIGNSPNISSRRYMVRVDTAGSSGRIERTGRRTGADSTSSYLVGGRLGLRLDEPGEMKVGVSVTRDEVNFLDGLEQITGDPRGYYREVPRIRVGGDLMYRIRGIFLEGEYIFVEFDENSHLIDLDLVFYYGTLGYNITERWLAYASFWRMEEDSFAVLGAPQEIRPFENDVEAPSVGTSYQANDRVVFKGQYTRVTVEQSLSKPSTLLAKVNSDVFSLAISVSF